MQKRAVTKQRFEGVAERVTEIQDGPQSSFFPFVPLDHVGLQPAATGNHMRQYIRLVIQNGGGIGFEIFEKRGIKNHAVFNHLGHAVAKLSVGQRGQRVGVDQYA